MEQIKQKQEKTRILILFTLLTAIGLCFLPRISQDVSYHLFADCRPFFNIHNFWNVSSNIPFLIIGTAGLAYVIRYRNNPLFKTTLPNFMVFFIGIFLTGIGSAYYHYTPNNTTLVWDRLPMTISFMSFFSIIISEFINPKRSGFLLTALLTIGLFSVLYWSYTESSGNGDLRLYIIVQFLPILIIPLLMLLFKGRNLHKRHLWLMLLFYALAKLSETFDLDIYRSLCFISGHSLKHFFAAAAPLLFLIGINRSLLRKKDPGQE